MDENLTEHASCRIRQRGGEGRHVRRGQCGKGSESAGCTHGDYPCNGASPIVPDQMKCFETERVRHAQYVSDQVSHSVRGRPCRSSIRRVPALIGSHGAVSSGGQGLNLVTVRVGCLRKSV